MKSKKAKMEMKSKKAKMEMKSKKAEMDCAVRDILDTGSPLHQIFTRERTDKSS